MKIIIIILIVIAILVFALGFAAQKIEAPIDFIGPSESPTIQGPGDQLPPQ